MEQICSVYWHSLYAHARHRGYSHEDAQDLTQGFLLQLLRRRTLDHVDGGGTRTFWFLLAGMNHFLSDQRDRACAQKRGGGQRALPLIETGSVGGFGGFQPTDDRRPDTLFERRWVTAQLTRVFALLEREFRLAGKETLLRHLRRFLVPGTHEDHYEVVGAELGMSVDAVKKAVHRMRQRYYELFREELARDLGSHDGIDEEMRHLCAVMSK